jgi:circadian clock protein KaiC
MSLSPPPPHCGTGIDGLDRILAGGFQSGRIYLAYGHTGTGKTTLGLQFLLAGAAKGEKGLFITFSETQAELSSVAHSHGWSLKSLELYETPADYASNSMEPQTVFPPAEVDLPRILKPILERVKILKPARVVLDSLAEIRFMAQDPMRYRQEIRLLKQAFLDVGATVLFLDDRGLETGEAGVESLLQGILMLEQSWPEYGRVRRRLRVIKMRAATFAEGYHDLVISQGGLRVFPRLIAAEHRRPVERRTIRTGLGALDEILGGGLDTGTSALIMGPAGSGKSNVATQILHAALARGEKAALFAFEETLATTLDRARSIGLPLEGAMKEGRLLHESVDPAELAAGEFAARVLDAVDRQNCRLIVLDSLNGYRNAMSEERHVALQLHELLTSLNEKGALTLLLLTQHGLLQAGPPDPVEVSYLADVVVALRYFEDAGRVRRAISVLKKRSGSHEETIRELMTDREGLRIGPTIHEFSGVLAGPLVQHGKHPPFMTERE